MPLLRRATTPQDVASGISGVLQREVARVYNTILETMGKCVKVAQKAGSFATYVTCVDSLPPKIRDVAKGATLQIVNSLTGRQWDWATLRRLAQSGDLPYLLIESIYGAVAAGEVPQQPRQRESNVRYA